MSFSAKGAPDVSGASAGVSAAHVDRLARPKYILNLVDRNTALLQEISGRAPVAVDRIDVVVVDSRNEEANLQLRTVACRIFGEPGSEHIAGRQCRWQNACGPIAQCENAQRQICPMKYWRWYPPRFAQ